MVEVDGLQARAPGIADLVPFAAFDDQQAAGLERLAMSFDDRQPRSRDHVKPLVRAAVPVVRAAFAVAVCRQPKWSSHPANVEGDAESRPEAEPLVLHARAVTRAFSGRDHA